MALIQQPSVQFLKQIKFEPIDIERMLNGQEIRKEYMTMANRCPYGWSVCLKASVNTKRMTVSLSYTMGPAASLVPTVVILSGGITNTWGSTVPLVKDASPKFIKEIQFDPASDLHIRLIIPSTAFQSVHPPMPPIAHRPYWSALRYPRIQGATDGGLGVQVTVDWDALIVVGEDKLYCHTDVLRQEPKFRKVVEYAEIVEYLPRSGLFRYKARIELKDTTIERVLTILEYIYAGSYNHMASLGAIDLIEVYFQADQFDLVNLKQACVATLERTSVDLKDLDELLQLLIFSRFIDHQILRYRALSGLVVGLGKDEVMSFVSDEKSVTESTRNEILQSLEVFVEGLADLEE